MSTGFELFGGKRIIGSAQLGDGVSGGVAVGIRGFGVGEAVLLSQGGDLRELVAALLVEIFFELRLVHEGSFGVRVLKFQYSGGGSLLWPGGGGRGVMGRRWGGAGEGKPAKQRRGAAATGAR